jgi:uncharacterized protein YutE (UPF0331/DUF86 family)
MSRLIERLAELRRHLAHLRALRPRVLGAQQLRADLSLHNDVLFSLMQVCQLVIDMAADLAARRGLRYEDYTASVRSLAMLPEFPPRLVEDLEKLPGFRNILVHEYVSLDYERVIEALDRLAPVEDFANRVADLLAREAI